MTQTPKSWPFGEGTDKGIEPPIYHEWRTEKAKADGYQGSTKRRIRRNPNHPRWNFRYSLLTWWQVRIKLLGTDPQGRRIIIIRPGDGEPIYIRIGNKVELFRNGKKMNWDDDVSEEPVTSDQRDLIRKDTGKVRETRRGHYG